MNRRTESGTEQGTRHKAQGTENRRRRKGDDILERVLDAVEGVRQLLPSLQGDPAAKHLALQLWRAATGGGSNYEAARSAESVADFIHKIRLATKELREAHFWLRILQRSDWVPSGSLDGLIDEFDQLVAILVVSARTAKSRPP